MNEKFLKDIEEEQERDMRHLEEKVRQEVIEKKKKINSKDQKISCFFRNVKNLMSNVNYFNNVQQKKFMIYNQLFNVYEL
jgi:hypothetical protein